MKKCKIENGKIVPCGAMAIVKSNKLVEDGIAMGGADGLMPLARLKINNQYACALLNYCPFCGANIRNEAER